MNPRRLSCSAYRSWAELDLELPLGCSAIVGENGAGKSSIVNAIELALFGSRNFGDYRMDSAPDSVPLVVELEFEHGGHEYRVRRSKTLRGSVKVDFEQRTYDYAEWAPLTRETAAATQALIEETIGLSRATFRASAFLAQGDGAAFTEAQPRDRKAILAEVLGLEVWDRLLERARNDRSALDDTGHRLALAIEAAELELAKRADVEAERAELAERSTAILSRVSEHEAERVDLQAQLVKAREQDVERRGLTEQLATARAALTATLDRHEELGRQRPDTPSPEDVAALEAEAGRVTSLEQELDDLARYERAKTRHRELLFERNRLLGEANELNEQGFGLLQEATLLEENGPDAGSCETCGQTLGAEALAKTLETMRARAVDLDRQAALKETAAQAIPVEQAAVGELDFRERGAIELELAAARNVAQALTRVAANRERAKAIDEELARIEERIPTEEAAVKALADRLDAFEEVVDAEVLADRLASCEARLAVVRHELETTRSGIAVTDDRLQRLGAVAVERDNAAKELRNIQAETDVVALCERAYGRDGIPTMIVENAAIPQIELEANRILGELGTSLTLELHTQREKKSGPGAVETLDIIVVGPAGARPYETFSGGERTRLNLALRIALARLLANRRGAEVRALVVDEPEFLDEPGVARLAEVLRDIPDFERVMLISHQPALREAFDEVIVVEKYAGASRLAGATASQSEGV